MILQTALTEIAQNPELSQGFSLLIVTMFSVFTAIAMHLRSIAIFAGIVGMFFTFVFHVLLGTDFVLFWVLVLLTAALVVMAQGLVVFKQRKFMG